MTNNFSIQVAGLWKESFFALSRFLVTNPFRKESFFSNQLDFELKFITNNF